MEENILIVEDEENISDLLAYALQKEGYKTVVASTGKEAFEILEYFTPNLVILDLMLPDISGLEICKKITTDYYIPIVMLTAKSDTIDKVVGLELGADDYISKPFNIREVIARVNSLLRRIKLLSNIIKADMEIISLDNGLQIDKREMTVKKEDEIINLTIKEYELILCLAENKNRVLTRSQLLDIVWGIDFECETRTVDTHIQRLRKKLGDNKESNIIETVIGAGYKLNDKKR